MGIADVVNKMQELRFWWYRHVIRSDESCMAKADSDMTQKESNLMATQRGGGWADVEVTGLIPEDVLNWKSGEWQPYEQE